MSAIAPSGRKCAQMHFKKKQQQDSNEKQNYGYCQLSGFSLPICFCFRYSVARSACDLAWPARWLTWVCVCESQIATLFLFRAKNSRTFNQFRSRKCAFVGSTSAWTSNEINTAEIVHYTSTTHHHHQHRSITDNEHALVSFIELNQYSGQFSLEIFSAENVTCNEFFSDSQKSPVWPPAATACIEGQTQTHTQLGSNTPNNRNVDQKKKKKLFTYSSSDPGGTCIDKNQSNAGRRIIICK